MAVIREIRARIRGGLCWRPIYARVSWLQKPVFLGKRVFCNGLPEATGHRDPPKLSLRADPSTSSGQAAKQSPTCKRGDCFGVARLAMTGFEEGKFDRSASVVVLSTAADPPAGFAVSVQRSPASNRRVCLTAEHAEGAEIFLFLSLIHISEPTRPY